MIKNNIITLKNLIGLFREFSNSHQQLSDFGFGPTYSIGTTVQMKPAYLWVTLQPSSISLVNNTSIPTYNFSVIIADKLNDNIDIPKKNGSESLNELNILSSMNQIAQDLVAEMSVNWSKYGILLNGEAQISPVSDETDDKVSGVAVNLAVTCRHFNCDLPLNIQ
jgi:hypothetical protein